MGKIEESCWLSDGNDQLFHWLKCSDSGPGPSQVMVTHGMVIWLPEQTRSNLVAFPLRPLLPTGCLVTLGSLPHHGLIRFWHLLHQIKQLFSFPTSSRFWSVVNNPVYKVILPGRLVSASFPDNTSMGVLVSKVDWCTTQVLFGRPRERGSEICKWWKPPSVVSAPASLPTCVISLDVCWFLPPRAKSSSI